MLNFTVEVTSPESRRIRRSFRPSSLILDFTFIPRSPPAVDFAAKVMRYRDSFWQSVEGSLRSARNLVKMMAICAISDAHFSGSALSWRHTWKSTAAAVLGSAEMQMHRCPDKQKTVALGYRDSRRIGRMSSIPRMMELFPSAAQQYRNGQKLFDDTVVLGTDGVFSLFS